MSGYDWEPEYADDRERAREWDRADERERAELEVRDRVTRDVGERRPVRLPLRENEAA